MNWYRFFPINSAGALIWATLDHEEAYCLQRHCDQVPGSSTIAGPVVAVAPNVGCLAALAQHETREFQNAKIAVPDPDGGDFGSTVSTRAEHG
jgi:membrane protein DedA with SNARE-associated domain